MLDYIIRFSLKNRFVVVSLTALFVVYGTLVVKELPIDVFPEISRPTVTVLTESHGMAPEEVELRVTAPIESYLNGLPGIERVRSQSGIGLSVINLEFSWGTDIYVNRQLVQEKLALAKERLPKDIMPTLGPVSSLMGQIQQIAFYSEDKSLSPLEIRDLAEWVVRPRILTIPGVAQVITIGGGLKQYQILLSADKINRYQLSLEDIDKELTLLSLNTTGGFLDVDEKEYLIRNLGAIANKEDIENSKIGMHMGLPVFVKNVAEVVVAPKLKRGEGSFNAAPAVIMTIQKQPGADTVQVSEGIEKAIAELRGSLPKNLQVNTDVFKQAHFIESSVQGVLGKLKFGSVLVLIILFLFLANLRMSLITLVAIPVSFVVSALIFKLLGMTVNTMTLGGLAIAIGELVDDAIVDVENVFRRLKENSLKSHPLPRLQVIYEASSEIRNSVVIATLIIAVVFLPLFQLTGLEGRLFTPLAISYLTALFASLVVSLSVTPALCYYFLNEKNMSHAKDTKLVQYLKNLDRKVLEWALPRAKQVLIGGIILFFGSLCLLPFMGKDFLPRFNEGTAMVSLTSPAGTSLAASNEIGLKAESLILETPEVKSVSRRTGRAEMDEHAMGVNVSEIDVDFKKEGRTRDVVLNEIREKLNKELPELAVNIGQPIGHLIEHMLSGVSAALVIKLYGPDLATLREKAFEIKEAISDVDGLVDLRVENQSLIPQVKVFVLREEAAKYGLSSGEVSQLLEGAFNGESVAQVLDENRIYDIFYRFDDNSKKSMETMGKTVLKTMPDGRRVLLEQVADIYEAYGPNEINRENGQRRIVISANLHKRDLGSIVEEIQSKVGSKVELPVGYFLNFGGQFESQKESTQKMILYGAFSLLLIAVILYVNFKSWTVSLQIIATIPLAFVGGVLALYMTERTITVASLVGFVTLCGLSSRNAVMMISHYLHLMKYEGHAFSREMIIKGSQDRLVPVLMTASVAGLALLPLVFAKGQPGSEILHPVAIVIVGGLMSSTLLDIIVTPALFYKFGKNISEKWRNENV